jgi:hypothetical protein
MVFKALLFAYYVLFVLDVHPDYMRHGWQRTRVYDTAREVAFKTNASPRDGLRLMQIACRESGFDPKAIGKKGERGRWQVMPPAKSYGADEALWRMRNQGMVAFVGCRHASDVVTIDGFKTTCQQMIDNRIGPADAYFAEHRPPPPDDDVAEPPTVALQP